MYDKSLNIKPFQCFYDVSGIIVNYGVVVGVNQTIDQDLITGPTISGIFDNFGAFVPTIEDRELLKFSQSGFSERNFLPFLDDNVIVSLKIELENIPNLVTEKNEEWTEIVYDGNNARFQEFYNRDFSVQLQRNYFNLEPAQSVNNLDIEDNSMLVYAESCQFNPFVNWSPKITNVSIVQTSFSGEFLEEDSMYYTIQENDGNYFKYVPIAIVEDFNVTQLLSKDYVFSFPFFWLDSLKEEFKYVPAEISSD